MELESINPFDESHGNLFVRTEHLARYLFAAQLAGKRRWNTVLDCASGNGYGSKVLTEAGCQVVAVDQQPCQCNVKGLTSHQADLNRGLPFCEDGTFDGIVCLETLEHIAKERLLLDEFHRVLRPGGSLVLSVPRRGYEPTDKRGRPLNPYHLRLYGEMELAVLLAECGFTVEKQLGQPYSNLLRANMESWRRDHGADAERIADFFVDSSSALRFYSHLWAWPTVEAAEHSNVLLFICNRSRRR